MDVIKRLNIEVKSILLTDTQVRYHIEILTHEICGLYKYDFIDMDCFNSCIDILSNAIETYNASCELPY